MSCSMAEDRHVKNQHEMNTKYAEKRQINKHEKT